MDAEDLVPKVTDNLSVRRAFGTAYEKDGTLIIPVAIVAGGGGGGTARTRRGDLALVPIAPAQEHRGSRLHTADPRHGRRGGLRPAAVSWAVCGPLWFGPIDVVRGDQVRWVPAVDVTIAVLASLSLVRMLARTWTRQRRHRGS